MTRVTGRAVHRFVLDLTDEQDLLLPADAHLLHVARRDGTNDRIDLWALVDPDQPPEPRRIRIAGTGHDLGDDALDYIGTVQLVSGRIVFHVFEVPTTAEPAPTRSGR